MLQSGVRYDDTALTSWSGDRLFYVTSLQFYRAGFVMTIPLRLSRSGDRQRSHPAPGHEELGKGAAARSQIADRADVRQLLGRRGAQRPLALLLWREALDQRVDHLGLPSGTGSGASIADGMPISRARRFTARATPVHSSEQGAIFVGPRSGTVEAVST